MMKPILAIETFLNGPDNSDLSLYGPSGIEYANIEFSIAKYNDYITDQNKIGNVVGYGPENTFFYKLCSYKDNNLVCHERGVGYAYQIDGKDYFKRDVPLIYGKNDNHFQIITDKVSRFYTQPDSINIISSETPPNLSMLFHDKNCVLVSREQFIPAATKILENSFLARIQDSDISNLSFDSKDFYNIVADALSNYSKQLSLKCSKLSASSVSLKRLQLEPNSADNVKKGTLVYDESIDAIKFYNGDKWRILKWEDQEKSE